MKGSSIEERFWSKVKKARGCWEWIGGKTSGGYGEIGVDGKIRIASRVAWELTNGSIPEGLFVLHRCDNRSCVNPEHLFLGTASDNIQDSVRKGRYNHLNHHSRGEGNPGHKLNEKDVGRIRTTTGSQRLIAREFGISQSQVSRIKTGKRWATLCKPVRVRLEKVE